MKLGLASRLQVLLTDSEIKLVWGAWEQIDGDWWTIPRTKSGRSHRVFLAPLAHELLARLDKRRKYCFPATTGTSGYLVRPYKALYRSRDASGIQDWTIHDLRRTAATQMASVGVRREVLRQVLGHADHSVTGIYDRASYDEDKRKAMVQWCDRLRQLVDREAAILETAG